MQAAGGHRQVEEGPSQGQHAQQQLHLPHAGAVGVETEAQRSPRLRHPAQKKQTNPERNWGKKKVL